MKATAKMVTESSAEGKNPPEYNLEKRLIHFAVSILELADGLPDTRAGAHIAGQIIGSGTSPAPNYGEARGAQSRRDFLHKMSVCLKELRETFVWLRIIELRRLAQDVGKLKWPLDECDQLISIFVTSIKTTKSNARPTKVR